MRLVEALQKVLDGFCGEPSEIQELGQLAAQLPESIGEFPAEVRCRAQRVILEALYYLGDLDRLEHFANPSCGAEADLWLGYALFDRGRYDEAAERFRVARDEVCLQEWAKCKVSELLLCCRVYTKPTSLTLTDFRELADLREGAETQAPMPMEIRSALNWATGAGVLTEDQARRFAEALRL